MDKKELWVKKILDSRKLVALVGNEARLQLTLSTTGHGANRGLTAVPFH